MLLRTTSTPTFRSSAPSSSSSSSSSYSCIDPSSWTDLSRSILSLTSAPVTTSDNRIRRTSSEQLLLMKHPKMKLAFPDDYTFPPLVEETVGSGEETASFMLSASSLVAKVAEGGRVGDSVGGGNGSGGDGGGGRGGGGGGRGGGGGEGNGSESMEAYYQKMVESFPGDALILGNYARFLKDVKGDADRAAEYCERAILAKRQRSDGDDEDGNLLSMYGDIIWKTQKDGVRAQTYFDQAVQSSPNDCFVLASYAQFLWDSGEDNEDEEETELHSKSLSSAAANANQNLTTTT